MIIFRTLLLMCAITMGMPFTGSLKAAGGYEEAAPRHTFTVTVYWKEMRPMDSLCLFLEDSFYPVVLRNKYQPSWSKNGVVKFVINSSAKRGRFSISRKTPVGHLVYGSSNDYLPFIPKYNWDAGDDVKMALVRTRPDKKIINVFNYDYRIEFTGKGAKKYEALQAVEEAWLSGETSELHADTVSYEYRNVNRYKLHLALEKLASYKNELTPFYYSLFHAEIVANMGSSFHHRITYFLNNEMMNRSSDEKERFKRSYLRFEEQMDTIVKFIPDSVAILSRGYIEFIYKKIRFHCFLVSGKMDVKGILNYILENYQDDLKDRLLIAALKNDSGSGMAELLFKDSFALIRNPECVRELDRVAAKMPGYKAYNFRLTDTAGNIVELSALRGNVIFIDFWFSNCGACEGYYKQTLKHAEELLQDNKDIKFVSICIDRGKEYWLKSLRSGDYTSGLALNLYTNGEGTDNDVTRYYGLAAFPQFMIVDANSKIYRFYRDFTSPDISNTSSLVNTLLNLAKKKAGVL